MGEMPAPFESPLGEPSTVSDDSKTMLASHVSSHANEHAPTTPAEVIANVLHHVEDEGLNDAQALELAGDILHALAVAGMVVVPAEDLDIIMNRGDKAVGWPRWSDACDRIRAALPERSTDV